MRPFYKMNQPLRTAVLLTFHGTGTGLVIRPTRWSAAKVYRHQLYDGDAYFAQVVQVLYSSSKRALGRERPHVKLIDNPLAGLQRTSASRMEVERSDALLQAHRETRGAPNTRFSLLPRSDVGMSMAKGRVRKGVLCTFEPADLIA